MEERRPVYPDDVQQALDHAAEEGWTTECYQAVLAMALRHLDINKRLPYPEVVVMVAEGDIDWVEEITDTFTHPHLIEDGEVYLVCPVCFTSGTFNYFSDGTEYADLHGLEETEEVMTEAVTASRHGYDFMSDGDWGLSHQSSHCYARLDLPQWFTMDD